LQFWNHLPAPKTAQQALNLSSPTLSIIKKEVGEIKAKAFLVMIIAELVESFNLGKTMNDVQVAMCVNMIQEQYYFLRPDELKYCFNKAKNGAYGVLYDRIDGAVICEWIEKYLQERTAVCYERATEEQKMTKKEFDAGMASILTDPKFKTELFKKLDAKDKVRDTTKEDKNPEPIKKREPTEQEILIYEFLSEFDSIYKKNPNKKKGQDRMIRYNGEMVTSNKFLELKIEEYMKNNTNTKPNKNVESI
jgi:hypothetical protein